MQIFSLSEMPKMLCMLEMDMIMMGIDLEWNFQEETLLGVLKRLEAEVVGLLLEDHSTEFWSLVGD